MINKNVLLTFRYTGSENTFLRFFFLFCTMKKGAVDWIYSCIMPSLLSCSISYVLYAQCSKQLLAGELFSIERRQRRCTAQTDCSHANIRFYQKIPSLFMEIDFLFIKKILYFFCTISGVGTCKYGRTDWSGHSFR